jgi:hypothetical protein
LHIGFIDHLQVVITNNYNTIADFHTLQITTVYAKDFPACSAFTRHVLVTALTMAITLLPCSSSLRTAAPFQLNYSSESESELLYDWRFTAKQFVLATSPLRFTTTNFIFQLNTCSYSPYVKFSLTRGWVCRLQLLLALTRTAILRSESRGTRDHILLSQIPDFPFNRLLRLAGLRWRYSTPPPHGYLRLFLKSKSKSHCD